LYAVGSKTWKSLSTQIACAVAGATVLILVPSQSVADAGKGLDFFPVSSVDISTAGIPTNAGSGFTFADDLYSDSPASSQSNKLNDYTFIGAGLGYGLTDITPNGDDYSYTGVSFGMRFGLEAPVVNFLSVHAAADFLWLTRFRFIEENTSSFGMGLSAGFSLGQRQVPGNFHVSASAGYGFASIGENRRNTICFSTECEEAADSRSIAGPTYRASVGYTMQQGAIIELVGQRIEETGMGLSEDATAQFSHLMVMFSGSG